MKLGKVGWMKPKWEITWWQIGRVAGKDYYGKDVNNDWWICEFMGLEGVPYRKEEHSYSVIFEKKCKNKRPEKALDSAFYGTLKTVYNPTNKKKSRIRYAQMHKTVTLFQALQVTV